MLFNEGIIMVKCKTNLLILSLSAVIASCSSGNSSTNSENINGLTVQSVFPPNGTTNIGIGEQFQFSLNRNVNPVLIKNYITVKKDNVEAAFNLISKNGTYYIIPLGGLQPDSVYSFSMNFPSANSESVASNNNYTMTTQPAYKIFVTSTSVEGNLGNPNTGQNAKEWADNLCNTDSARPNTSVTYKAMMGIPSLRYACDDDGYCGAGHDLDWVLQSQTGYYDVGGVEIGTANPFATFTFPVLSYIKNADIKVWTGLNASWINSNNCKSWTTKHDDENGRVGWVNQTNERLIDLEKHACNKDRPLYCVEQPQALIAEPELSALNKYMVTNLNSPIKVRFNSVSPIDPTTVTSSSFLITDSSDINNTPLAGSITSNGDNTFTFTPASPYLAGKTYYVNLTTGIKDTQGQPIVKTVLYFFTPASTKLIFMTQDDYWGDLGSIAGADGKCQADPKCPAGSVCKAIIMQVNTRYACTTAATCGGVYSKDWVLTANTTYLNTSGQIVSITNESGTFGDGSGKFAFNYPIDITGGHAWTGFDNFFMIKYNDGKPLTCSSWSIGDSGVNALGGLYGDSRSIYPTAFSDNGGGCSKYTNEVDYGVYVDKQCNIDGGCSKRHLYCAQQ
ncbi:MAG: DUF1554 domain-containing protein [Proteobacteria bacterium]|nr:MAG: DUF1554 domain-containing protein [Pseudomonadota bacterium]